MNRRNFVIYSASAGLAGALSSIVPAFASSQWCDTDPVVVIYDQRTDKYRTLNLLVQAEAGHQAEVDAETHFTSISYPGDNLKVELAVLVPGNNFRCRASVSEGGVELARVGGQAGHTMLLTFTL